MLRARGPSINDVTLEGGGMRVTKMVILGYFKLNIKVRECGQKFEKFGGLNSWMVSYLNG